MVIKRSSSAEVSRLVERLLTADPVSREAAAARLAIVGVRATERLNATLKNLDREDQLIAVLDVIERIGDPRSVPAVERWIGDARDTVATTAISVIRRALQAADPEAAAHAADVLIGVASDATRSEVVRRVAAAALGDLPGDVLASLRGNRAIPWSAEVVEEGQGSPRTDPSPEKLLATWIEGQATSLSHEALREILAENADSTPLPLLHQLVLRLRSLESAATPDEAPEWRQLRGVVHQALASRDSRVALYDLRETLERRAEDLTVTMLAALGAVGDASCIEPVANAWARTSDPWLKDHLYDAFRAIVGRETLTRRHASLRRVASRHPELLATLNTPLRTRPSPRRADRT